ncbi:MAG: tetratricopeptide repeat protein [Gemmatimonadetes bacterium]|nr:tetratricopeptide repeat protein [Gemmatimonadota bacterium]
MLEHSIEAAQEAERAGAWDVALARYEEAFSRLSREGDAGTAASVLRWIGRVHRERGDLELAQEMYEASSAVAEAGGLRWHAANALVGLASVEQWRGRLDEAERLYTRAGEISEEAGDDGTCAIVCQNLAILANIRGDVAAALEGNRSALERFRRLGNDRAASQVLNNLGMSYVDLGDWAAAERAYDEASTLAEVAGDRYMTGAVEVNRAELYLQRERFEQARESCDRAVQVFTGLRSKSWIAETYKLYGMLYRDTGKPEQADTHFSLALGLAEASQNRLLEAEAQMEWALLRMEEERYQDAVLYLNRALGVFRQLQARREVMDIERRLSRLEAKYLPAVRSWGAAAVESRDRYRTGCTQRIAEYSARLGERVGLSCSEVTWLRVGAFVHEVGSSAIPVQVLGKPGALTPAEREVVQVHTVVGEALVSQMGFPAEVQTMVRSHHERWNGSGYPDRLRGEAIPRSARILGVASVYDALTSERPYRPAYSRGEALAVLERESGVSLDPELVGNFRALV